MKSQRKHFFFEKKKQKTFAILDHGCVTTGGSLAPVMAAKAAIHAFTTTQ